LFSGIDQLGNKGLGEIGDINSQRIVTASCTTIMGERINSRSGHNLRKKIFQPENTIICRERRFPMSIEAMNRNDASRRSLKSLNDEADAFRLLDI
jgi:hypothetical protein